MRRLYFKLSDEFLERLARVAAAERRDVRVQATICIELGIAQLERQHGLEPPDLLIVGTAGQIPAARAEEKAEAGE